MFKSFTFCLDQRRHCQKSQCTVIARCGCCHFVCEKLQGCPHIRWALHLCGMFCFIAKKVLLLVYTRSGVKQGLTKFYHTGLLIVTLLYSLMGYSICCRGFQSFPPKARFRKAFGLFLARLFFDKKRQGIVIVCVVILIYVQKFKCGL